MSDLLETAPGWLRVRRRMLSIAAAASALALGVSPQFAQALEVKPYTAQAFDEAVKANRPIAVHFRTSWCSVCKAQQVLLNQMQTKAEPGFELTVLAVDYDKDQAARARHKTKERSTLIAYVGAVEKARLEGSADEARMKQVLKAALAK
jgi:thioredoxin 1